MTSKFAFGIGARIYLIIGIALVALVGMVALGAQRIGDTLEAQKRIELQHLIDVTLRIAKDEDESAKAAGRSQEDAQQRAAARIGSLRYGNNDYFWINDLQTRIVTHPTLTKYFGKETTDIQDPSGLRIFVAFVDMVKQNGIGFVAYQWPKPGSEQPQPKLSYVAGYAPWSWVI
jgi:methyl-accepting chemotaxis protein